MGDAVQLVDGATNNTCEWRGGKGAMIVYGGTVPSTVDLQMSPDNGTTWIDVYCDGRNDQKVSVDGAAGCVNFVLPRCYIRTNQTSGWGSGVAWAVGI